MGLIEEARETALAEAARQREAGRASALVEAQKHRDYLAQRWGFPVELILDPLEYAADKPLYDKWPGGSREVGRQPERLKTNSYFLVAGEIRIVWKYDHHSHHSGREDFLIRTCIRCGKFGHDRHGWSPYIPSFQAYEEDKQLAFTEALGEAVVKDFLCSFCVADETVPECPTCGRRWDR